MKKLSIIMIVIICIVFATGCGATKLSKDFSKQKLKAGTEAVIKNLNENKFQAIVDNFRPDLRKGIKADQLQDAWNGLGNLGKYASITRIIYQEQKKEHFVVVVAIAKFEKKNVQFTVSFDSKMELVGLYMK